LVHVIFKGRSPFIAVHITSVRIPVWTSPKEKTELLGETEIIRFKINVMDDDG